MKKYLKGILTIVFAVLVFLPTIVFAEEVTNVFIDKDNKLSFTGANGYSVYQVYVKYGETVVDAFGTNCNGKSSELTGRIKTGCDNLTDVCPENYAGNYTLEIVAFSSNVEVEETRTTKPISLKYEEFNGDDYYHVDVVGNETTYTITLDPNDGIQTPQTMSGLTFGQHVQLADYTSYGYVAQPKTYYYGWSPDEFNVTHDMTVELAWEPIFTMSIDFNGGSLDGEDTYTKESVGFGPSTGYENVMSAFTPGKEVVPPVGKEIDHITVDGVTYAISNENGFMLDHDVEIVYYWKWKSTTTVRTVTLTDGFGNTIDTVEVADGETMEEPATPEVGGLLFTGWRLSSIVYDFDDPITQDLTLEASWNYTFYVTANVPFGAAIFTYNGTDYDDSVGSAGYYHEGELWGVDQRGINGYELKEWRLDSLNGDIIGSDSTQDIYIAPGGHLKVKQSLETAGRTFYAIYEKTKIAVTFNTNGGTAIETQYITPGERATKPASNASTKAGYLLGDWYTDPELTHKFNFNTPLDEGITLYASWNIYIDEVRAYVNKPVVGFKADTNIISNDNRYTFEFREWYLVEDPYPHVEGDDVFENGKEYDIRYYVKPAEGYGVDYNTVFYLNDETTTSYGAAEARQTRYAAAAPSVVTSFNISGIKNPIIGQKPDYNSISLNTTGLVLGEVYWAEEGSGNVLTTSDKFVSGKRYILHVEFNTAYGYILPDGYDEGAISGAPKYLMAELVNNGDVLDMQIRYEAKSAPKVTVVPTIKAKNANDNTLSITWNAVANAEKYILYRSTDKKKWTTISTGTDLSYTDTGLVYGKAYYYKVKAMNDISAKESKVVTGKTLPNKVTNLKVKSGSTTNIVLTWDKVNVTGYEVYSSINKKTWYKNATISKNGTVTYNNKSLKANTTYYYKVVAYKTVSGKKVYGAYSAILTTKTAPAKTKLTISIKNHEAMNVKPAAAKGATKYVIQKSLDGKTYEDLTEVTGSVAYTDNGHAIGSTYYYRVKACNKYNNCSAWVVANKTQTTIAPTGVNKVAEPLGIELSWNAAEGATGYEVYRATSKTGKYTLVKSVTGTSLINRGLKEKTTYYYKIRSYTTVGSKKYYSGYTKVITAKTTTMTKSQSNALKSAKSYLKYLSFSYEGLIEQLKYEKFSTADATFAVDNCGANWKSQALKSAKSYLRSSSFSYEGLIDQLEYEKFTHEQAVYAVDNCGADWNEQAYKTAQSYLKYSSFSRQGLIDQLLYEKFTYSQALYAVNKVGL